MMEFLNNLRVEKPEVFKVQTYYRTRFSSPRHDLPPTKNLR